MENISLLREEILNYELALLTQDVRYSPSTLESLMADEFLEFGSSGRQYTKQQAIQFLKQSPSIKAKISHFEIRRLSQDILLATYRVAIKTATGDILNSLRSSIWKGSAGNFRIVFHQGTPL